MMASASSIAVLNHFRTLFATGSSAGLSDSQLLEQIRTGAQTAAAAEAAFEVLLARHGPMVLGVCRRALADPSDVEDAFQATFLVLVRKSNSVRVDDSLGRWLYGVARRVARRASVQAARRRGRATTAEELAILPRDPERAELLSALDDELARLPERYRAPLMLCYLEGVSQVEAARRLGWPTGTVKGRIAQGRTLLRTRLTRRGLAPSAVLLGVALEADARVVLPSVLARKTLISTLPLAVGRTTATVSASTTALALAKGTMNAMLMLRIRTAVLCFLAALEVGAGALVLSHPLRAGGDETANAGILDPGTTFSVRPDEGGRSESPRPVPPDLAGVPVVNRVKTSTTILYLVADGSKVQKGDLICKLDADELYADLADQRIAAEGARARYLNAKLTREAAELALREYEEGVFIQEKETLLGEIALAEAELKRAEDRVGWSQRMKEKGYVSLDQSLAELVSLKKTKFALEQAQTKKDVLERFTYGKKIKELKSEIEKARSEEVARLQAARREDLKQSELAQQVKNCRILAPVSGRLVYARWRIPGDEARLTKVMIGEVVRWRQLLFRIMPGGQTSR